MFFINLRIVCIMETSSKAFFLRLVGVITKWNMFLHGKLSPRVFLSKTLCALKFIVHNWFLKGLYDQFLKIQQGSYGPFYHYSFPTRKVFIKFALVIISFHQYWTFLLCHRSYCSWSLFAYHVLLFIAIWQRTI